MVVADTKPMYLAERRFSSLPTPPPTGCPSHVLYHDWDPRFRPALRGMTIS
jgi:hypothetical protein